MTVPGELETGELKTLPLDELHRAAGARFGAFAGWSMPITYRAGVMKEHLHTREKAGLFDISHMKLLVVDGPQAVQTLARACPLDPAALEPSQSKYTFFLDSQAGILDDLIVTRTGENRFVVVANAGNAEADERHLREIAAKYDCTVEALDRVILALQGPAAEDVTARAGIAGLPAAFMNGAETPAGWFVSRSGYTGEDGFEMAVPLRGARALAEKLLADDRVNWIGLAARDSLRLEAGFCLHGQDITAETSPLEAGLLWAIPKSVRESGTFMGADALRGLISMDPAERRVGLKPEGRQPVRAGAQLFDGKGEPVGRVTSGGFGPSVDGPVAMGYVADRLAVPGTALFAEVRGNRMPVAIHPLPFTPHRSRKG